RCYYYIVAYAGFSRRDLLFVCLHRIVVSVFVGSLFHLSQERQLSGSRVGRILHATRSHRRLLLRFRFWLGNVFKTKDREEMVVVPRESCARTAHLVPDRVPLYGERLRWDRRATALRLARIYCQTISVRRVFRPRL